MPIVLWGVLFLGVSVLTQESEVRSVQIRAFKTPLLVQLFFHRDVGGSITFLASVSQPWTRRRSVVKFKVRSALSSLPLVVFCRALFASLAPLPLCRTLAITIWAA